MGDKGEAKGQAKPDLAGGLIIGAVGVALLLGSWMGAGLPRGLAWSLGLGGVIVLCVGLANVAGVIVGSRRLRTKEVMRLAEARGGLLTLGEIATALDVDPGVARRTLAALAKEGIATQRWAEVRKNLWEFPDYMKLPLSESIELAKAKGGRLSVEDLEACGHSAAVARETLEALSEKGLARAEAGGGGRAVVVTSQ